MMYELIDNTGRVHQTLKQHDTYYLGYISATHLALKPITHWIDSDGGCWILPLDIVMEYLLKDHPTCVWTVAK